MINHIEPVSRRSATGTTATVYERLQREFGLHAEPITLHSPDADLLAGAWNLCREHLVARGRVERERKEVVATAVSAANRCPFCVDAHAAMLSALGGLDTARTLEAGRLDRLPPALEATARWAAATRRRGALELREPPFGEDEAPEMIGTAVLFHYINRPVNVFLDETPFPSGARALRTGMLWVAGRRFKGVVSVAPEPGETLDLAPATELPDDLGWARGSEPIAAAWARFSGAVERLGARALPPSVRERVSERLRVWDGDDPGLGLGWLEDQLEGLAESDRPAGRLALLTAFASYRVDEDVVASYGRSLTADGRSRSALTVGAVAWSAFAAARTIGSWLTQKTARKASW